MNNSLINKIEQLKDAIKNCQQIIENYLQQILSLQNQSIINQQEMIKLDGLISETIIQEDMIKKKNGIIQTNIDHIKGTSGGKQKEKEQLTNSCINSQNINQKAKDKLHSIQIQFQQCKSQSLVRAEDKQNQMNMIMNEFKQVQIEKQRLAIKFNELKQYEKSHFEIANKFKVLEKQKEFLEQQLAQLKPISENQEKQINLLRSENEKLKKLISENRKKSLLFDKRIKDIENHFYSPKNENCMMQVSEELLEKMQDQILLTNDQIGLLKTQHESIDKCLSIHNEDHEFLSSIDLDELSEKAESMQEEINDDKKKLLLLMNEREELMNEEIVMKFCTNENRQKLTYLQKLKDYLKKIEGRDSIYQKEIVQLRNKSEKLEGDLNSLEETILRKKAENEEIAKRIQIGQELKNQHEKIMGQIQSKFKANEIKLDQEKIDTLHEKNKILMKKILKFEDSLGQKRIKKKKVIKKQPFIH